MSSSCFAGSFIYYFVYYYYFVVLNLYSRWMEPQVGTPRRRLPAGRSPINHPGNWRAPTPVGLKYDDCAQPGRCLHAFRSSFFFFNFAAVWCLHIGLNRFFLKKKNNSFQVPYNPYIYIYITFFEPNINNHKR